jgi:hypothetical protein
MPTVQNSAKAGWPIDEWFPAVGISRSKTYQLMDGGVIPNVKIDRRRLIIISPADFLTSYAERSAQIERGSALPIVEAAPDAHYSSGDEAIEVGEGG